MYLSITLNKASFDRIGQMRNLRLPSTIIIFFAILFLPYWIYIPALIVAMAALPLYWESIFLGFLIDILYGEGIYAGLLALGGLILLLPLRSRLRSHV